MKKRRINLPHNAGKHPAKDAPNHFRSFVNTGKDNCCTESKGKLFPPLILQTGVSDTGPAACLDCHSRAMGVKQAWTRTLVC